MSEKPANIKPQISAEEARILGNVLDRATELKEILVAHLRIEMAYQDRPRDRLVKKITYEFKRGLLNVLSVARHPDGSLWVVDGATRLLALRALKMDNSAVECLIYDTENIAQDALLFKLLNSEKNKVGLDNRMVASGLAGLDQGFLAAVEEGGFSFLKSRQNYLRGSGYVRQAFDRWGAGAVKRGLLVAKNSFQSVPDGGVACAAIGVLDYQPLEEAALRRALCKYNHETLRKALLNVTGELKVHPRYRPQFISKVLGRDMNHRRAATDKIDTVALYEYVGVFS